MSVTTCEKPCRGAGRRAIYPLVLIVLAAFLPALSLPLAAAGDAGEGKRIAEKWCVGCHLVDGAPQAGVADVAPPLTAISADPAKTPAYLRTYLANPRHPMPDFSLSRHEIDDLAAYISGLAHSSRGRR
jgi:mono/diheme cytochrome c family protein